MHTVKYNLHDSRCQTIIRFLYNFGVKFHIKIKYIVVKSYFLGHWNKICHDFMSKSISLSLNIFDLKPQNRDQYIENSTYKWISNVSSSGISSILSLGKCRFLFGRQFESDKHDLSDRIRRILRNLCVARALFWLTVSVVLALSGIGPNLSTFLIIVLMFRSAEMSWFPSREIIAEILGFVMNLKIIFNKYINKSFKRVTKLFDWLLKIELVRHFLWTNILKISKYFKKNPAMTRLSKEFHNKN